MHRIPQDDVQIFIQKLNAKTGKRYRLPTESEWEYAARAGSTTAYSLGNGSTHLLGRHAWFGSNAGGTTHPVGEKLPNNFGLHDMYGNVFEWTEDCWNKSYQGAPTDGSAWTSGDCGSRVVRGGSWYFDPRNLRAARRSRNTTDGRNDDLGFRLGRTLTPWDGFREPLTYQERWFRWREPLTYQEGIFGPPVGGASPGAPVITTLPLSRPNTPLPLPRPKP